MKGVRANAARAVLMLSACAAVQAESIHGAVDADSRLDWSGRRRYPPLRSRYSPGDEAQFLINCARELEVRIDPHDYDIRGNDTLTFNGQAMAPGVAYSNDGVTSNIVEFLAHPSLQDTGAGFAFTWRCTDPLTCAAADLDPDVERHANDDEYPNGTIVYPDPAQKLTHYANDREACWEIVCDGSVVVETVSFDVEKDDTLSVNGERLKARLVSRRVPYRALPPSPVTVADGVARIYFASDYAGRGRGFELAWSCGPKVTETTTAKSSSTATTPDGATSDGATMTTDRIPTTPYGTPTITDGTTTTTPDGTTTTPDGTTVVGMDGTLPNHAVPSTWLTTGQPTTGQPTTGVTTTGILTVPDSTASATTGQPTTGVLTTGNPAVPDSTASATTGQPMTGVTTTGILAVPDSTASATTGQPTTGVPTTGILTVPDSTASAGQSMTGVTTTGILTVPDSTASPTTGQSMTGVTTTGILTVPDSTASPTITRSADRAAAVGVTMDTIEEVYSASQLRSAVEDAILGTAKGDVVVRLNTTYDSRAGSTGRSAGALDMTAPQSVEVLMTFEDVKESLSAAEQLSRKCALDRFVVELAKQSGDLGSALRMAYKYVTAVSVIGAASEACLAIANPMTTTTTGAVSTTAVNETTTTGPRQRGAQRSEEGGAADIGMAVGVSVAVLVLAVGAWGVARRIQRRREGAVHVIRVFPKGVDSGELQDVDDAIDGASDNDDGVDEADDAGDRGTLGAGAPPEQP